MNDQSNNRAQAAVSEAATSSMVDSTIVDSAGAATNSGLAIGNTDTGANSSPTASTNANTNPVANPVSQPIATSSEPGVHAVGQNEFHMKLVSSRRPEPGTSRGVGERRERQRGIGVMGQRVRDPDGSSSPHEVVDEARSAARSSGHRFDLMRYLRLRRKR